MAKFDVLRYLAEVGYLTWIIILILVMLLLFLQSLPAQARDSRCTQLEQLAVQYANVSLTPSQKVFKRQATAWYSANCRSNTRTVER